MSKVRIYMREYCILISIINITINELSNFTY